MAYIAQSSVEWLISAFRARLGDPYVYGGDYSPTDTSQGCDCSYVVGWALEALTKGPANMSWDHNVSTESWPFDYSTNTPAAPGTVGPYGTISVGTNLSLIPADAALVIDIMHGGGGEDSHCNCVVGGLHGTILESNGGNGNFPGGSCTNGTGAYPPDASLWTDHWYLPGPIGTPLQGLDYAGGRPSGADIIAAGYQFVCRYVTDGGSSLPDKILTAAEAQDLQANNVGVVSNWESTGTDAQQGHPNGVSDAQRANANHLAAGGPPRRPN
jgi:hypothetical protein